jgi:2-polyprenyl-6-methoxyphenol hydroxylase-like FAD-dependent oxidoreductase
VFGHTTEPGYDLVVGADGAWSRVRALLSDVEPAFTGLGMYEISVPDREARTPELYARNRRGSTFACDEGRRLSVQQMGSGELSVSVVFRADESWIGEERKRARSLDQVKELLLGDERDYSSRFNDYHPLLRDALAKAEGRCTPRALYKLPVGFRWQHRRGVTLVGDAAHVMAPFAGVGVNVGLDDARGLASAIVAAVAASKLSTRLQGDAASVLERLDGAVEGFEKAMWPRVERYTRLTEEVTELHFFTPGSPRSAIASIVSAHARFETPWIFRPLATAGVHAFYFFKHLVGSKQRL